MQARAARAGPLVRKARRGIGVDTVHRGFCNTAPLALIAASARRNTAVSEELKGQRIALAEGSKAFIRKTTGADQLIGGTALFCGEFSGPGVRLPTPRKSRSARSHFPCPNRCVGRSSAKPESPKWVRTLCRTWWLCWRSDRRLRGCRNSPGAATWGSFTSWRSRWQCGRLGRKAARLPCQPIRPTGEGMLRERRPRRMWDPGRG